jgi:zinc transport system substrate-binding protein
MRRLIAICTVAVACLVSTGCGERRDPWAGAAPGQLRVLTSFPPIYCFTANVAGEQAAVKCLLTGTGPHDYSASAMDSLKVAGADLFVVNGLELDEFVTKLVSRSGNRRSDLVFRVGEEIEHDLLIHLEEHERKHVHEDGGECVHGEHDPHVWLGPDEAIAMVKQIGKRLGVADPPNQKLYDDRAEAYVKKLNELKDYGLAQFESAKNRRIVTTHDSLRYFARAYGLESVGSIQPRAGTEADSGQLAKLADFCREKQVRAIIIEPQYSKGAAESLQKHLKSRHNYDLQLVEFDPLETAHADRTGNPDPDLYLRVMRQNIDNLAKALK